MTTKLNKFCENILEVCWLFAIILAPLFFNIYSSRIFEPDKIALLRSLALITLLAWFVKWVEESRGKPLSRNSFANFKAVTQIPFVPIVIALIIVFIISTVLSVTPRVSFWGSYQRLQGFYTTLAYLVFFASVASNLHTRKQVERLVSSAIIVSFPVALYGVFQHYKLDPIPWSGDISLRITSSMGNSIFISAYLIMIFPLTLSRLLQTIRAIWLEQGELLVHLARSTIYIFILILQLLSIYWSGSRGPVLGLMAFTFLFILLITIYFQKRWLTVLWVAGALAGVIFLLVFNLENGPLSTLRSSPAIGRFGLLLDAESNSALVRKYIWEGDVKMVSPHPPLNFPDGRVDSLNFARILIGYGPESMFVSYSPFYVPALGVVERRNAVPDRSHNESWDTLVITGVFGLIVYLSLFISVFYYGLKWLGLIQSKRRRIGFFACLLGGGLIGLIYISIWRGPAYFGIGLPVGMFVGLVAYCTLSALFPFKDSETRPSDFEKQIFIFAILGAILAHFIEINFGISIAVTRIYFWIYVAVLFVVGYKFSQSGIHFVAENNIDKISPKENNISSPELVKRQSTRQTQTSKKKRAIKSSHVRKQKWGGLELSDHAKEAISASIILSVILVTLGFSFITNPSNSQSPLNILWDSLSNLRGNKTYAVLALISSTWAICSILFATEAGLYGDHNENAMHKRKSLFAIFGVILGSSFLLAIIYWLWQGVNLGAIAGATVANMNDVMAYVESYEYLLTKYVLYLLLLLIGLSFTLPTKWPRNASFSQWGVIAGTIGLIIALLLAYQTNIRVIQADIAFKWAESLSEPGTYQQAIAIYQQANRLAPNEDYYYLFLARNYLDLARTTEQESQRDSILRQAENDLLIAQKINPLNTDHTANLARLYNFWASTTKDTTERQRLANVADKNYSRSIELSPNNVRLWSEWAALDLNLLNKPDEAFDKLNHALEIDDTYDWTYYLLGQYYRQLAGGETTDLGKKNALETASGYYQNSLEKTSDVRRKYDSSVGLGEVDTLLGKIDSAISAYEIANTLTIPGLNKWKINEQLARLYLQLGEIDKAKENIQLAIQSAPKDLLSSLQQLSDQINAMTSP